MDMVVCFHNFQNYAIEFRLRVLKYQIEKQD